MDLGGGARLRVPSGVPDDFRILRMKLADVAGNLWDLVAWRPMDRIEDVAEMMRRDRGLYDDGETSGGSRDRVR